MSPRRSRPISNVQASVGVLAIVAVVSAIVGLSHALLLQVDLAVPLPAQQPSADLENVRQLADPSCPSRQDLQRRGDPVEVTSAELVDCPDAFDGQRVRYAGEAVGVVLQRGERAWVHVNDDPYGLALGPLPSHRVTAGGNAGMAVSVPVADATSVRVGDFRHHGTGLSIVGTYLTTHPDDAGSPAIHADSVELVQQPREVPHPVSMRRVLAAIVAVVVTLGLTLVRRRQSRA